MRHPESRVFNKDISISVYVHVLKEQNEKRSHSPFYYRKMTMLLCTPFKALLTILKIMERKLVDSKIKNTPLNTRILCSIEPILILQ